MSKLLILLQLREEHMAQLREEHMAYKYEVHFTKTENGIVQSDKTLDAYNSEGAALEAAGIQAEIETALNRKAADFHRNFDGRKYTITCKVDGTKCETTISVVKRAIKRA